MISAEQIASLAGSLGTLEGLAQVNLEMDKLHLDATEGKITSREELAEMMRALNSLNAAIQAMDRVTRDLLNRAGLGAIDCVG